MNQDQLSRLVEKIVMATISDNEEFVTKGLSTNLDWDNGWEKTIGQAIVNAVTVSTRLSVQLVLTLLVQSGEFCISEDLLWPELTVLRGGSDLEDKNQPPEK